MKHFNKYFCLTGLFVFTATFFSLFIATFASAAPTSSKQPIHIKSDSMEAVDKAGKVVFKGNVVAVKGDLTINSDRLEVIYSKQDTSDSDNKQNADNKKRRRLKRLIATGHVKIIQGKKVGTCKEAVYDKNSEKLILTGDAQVWEGSNRIKGSVITMYINEDRSVVQGSQNQKVEATVYSD